MYFCKTSVLLLCLNEVISCGSELCAIACMSVNLLVCLGVCEFTCNVSSVAWCTRLAHTRCSHLTSAQSANLSHLLNNTIMFIFRVVLANREDFVSLPRVFSQTLQL